MSWMPSHYCLEREETDNDLAELFGILALLQETIHSKRPQQPMKAILKRLHAYAERHFQTEEALMDRIQYPLASDHKREHGTFLDQLRLLDTLVEYGFAEAALYGVHAVRDWIQSHMNLRDREFVEHLKRTA